LEFVRYLYFTSTFNKYFGWKHAQVDIARIMRNPRSMETLFLILTKNPYSFLLSLYKKPYHYKLKKSDFESFLQSSWETVGFEHGPARYANPVELWNAKNKAYLDLHCSGLKVEMIRYEDLVADPVAIFEHLYVKYNLRKTNNFFSNITKSMKGEREKDFAFYKKYYLQQEWKEKLTDLEITIINRFIDYDTLKKVGYQTIRT